MLPDLVIDITAVQCMADLVDQNRREMLFNQVSDEWTYVGYISECSYLFIIEYLQCTFQMVSLFSARNYCGEFDNAAAILTVSKDLVCSFHIYKVLYIYLTTFITCLCGHIVLIYVML